jgi:hypothetical protein
VNELGTRPPFISLAIASDLWDHGLANREGVWVAVESQRVRTSPGLNRGSFHPPSVSSSSTNPGSIKAAPPST